MASRYWTVDRFVHILLTANKLNDKMSCCTCIYTYVLQGKWIFVCLSLCLSVGRHWEWWLWMKRKSFKGNRIFQSCTGLRCWNSIIRKLLMKWNRKIDQISSLIQHDVCEAAICDEWQMFLKWNSQKAGCHRWWWKIKVWKETLMWQSASVCMNILPLLL